MSARRPKHSSASSDRKPGYRVNNLKPRILIVDDEPVMRTITESVLAQHEFEVSTASSAEQAILTISEGHVPDLILLDVLMPGMNGFEACRILRRKHRLEHLPIIMLTALDDQVSIDEAYRCGATDFITKPLNIPLMPHRIRYLLRSASAIRELYDSQAALINTQQIARLGNWTTDTEGNVTRASREYLEIIGASQLPFPDQRLMARVHREDRTLLLRQRAEMRMGRPYQIDYRLRSATDENTWQHVHERGFPRFDERHRYIGAEGFTQDITERVSQEERIRDLAWHDAVTGLNNRARLVELLEREASLSEKHHLSIVFIHLANLRDVQSVLGQDVADIAMRALSGRLRGLLESPEECNCGNHLECMLEIKLARYDEHSLIAALPGSMSKDMVQCFSGRIIEVLQRPLLLQGEEILIKAFVGIADYPEHADAIPELMRQAMLVATQASASGGTSVSFFDPQHDRAASHRMMLERHLRAAIDQGGQLEPYFQPKLCAQTGKQTGAEVLLRWKHPELGMISPGEFIPLAEETGLIHPISEWLIAHVCDLIADWQTWGMTPGRISINLSANSLFERSLIQFIDEQLLRTGVPPESLVIELTESVLMQNADTAQSIIDQIRQRGIHVSLDDFGTGFSSLGYLNRFSIDEIKIDRSFVIDLENDGRERALVHAIITLGHALGLTVVAEGVETETQAALLREIGCDTFQGFLFARPMPVQEFVAFKPAAMSPSASGGVA